MTFKQQLSSVALFLFCFVLFCIVYNGKKSVYKIVVLISIM